MSASRVRHGSYRSYPTAEESLATDLPVHLKASTSYSKRPEKFLPAIHIASDNGIHGYGSSQKVIGVERAKDWVAQVERSRNSQRMEMNDGDTNGASYTQPFWSVSTEVMDSLVDELNSVHNDPPSLPTTASIISANERRCYIMQSDDEDEKRSSPNEDGGFMESPRSLRSPRRDNRYSSYLSPVSTAGRKRDKTRGRLGPTNPSSPLSPISPLDLFPSNPRSSMQSDKIDKPLLASAPSPAPSLPSEEKVPALSIDDIIKRYKNAVGEAENAVKEKARKELGITQRKEGQKSDSMQVFTPGEQSSTDGGDQKLSRVGSASLSPTETAERTREKVCSVGPNMTAAQISVGPKNKIKGDSVLPKSPCKAANDSPVYNALPVPFQSNTPPPLSSANTQTPASRRHPRISQSKTDDSVLKRSASYNQPTTVKNQDLFEQSTCSTSDPSVDGDSLLQGARMGQAFLDQLDHDSVSNSSVLSERANSLRKSCPRTSSRASTPSKTPKGSKRLSLPITPNSTPDLTEGETHEHAKYLRSPHLNRTLTIAHPHSITVSYADVGHPRGYPVVFFLGLGCVRYLIALFDDIARAFNLRLVCIDRWGLGKTTQIAQDKRDIHEWAKVVERVLNEMKVDKFQVVAHSAGAPYALATVMRMKERVRGKLHLLAPWVGAEIDGGYKWLKWLPKGVIKGATAAEWKLQSYLLGKPPPLRYKPVGHNANSPIFSTYQKITPAPSSDEEGPYEDSRSAVSSTSFAKAPGLVKRASKFFGPRSTDIFVSEDQNSKHHRTKNLRSLKNIRTQSERDIATLSCPPRSGSPHWLSETTPLPPSGTDGSDPESDAEFGFGIGEGFDAMSINLRMPPPPSMKFTPSYASFRTTPIKTASHTSPSLPTQEPDRPKAPTGAAFTLVLTQASHAECEPGTTSDLLSIVLNKGGHAKPAANSGAGLGTGYPIKTEIGAGRVTNTIDYSQIQHPAKVWWGKEDDRISEKSMRWMESCMPNVQLKMIEREGHGLLSSITVMWEVFESLGVEAKSWRRSEE
ncbi:hypothetical protein L204_101638 [Cryptococcus depauperatus]|nr:hypothetical protein L204_04398 [Cryptococcus depauperatus CBS 7855]